MSSNSFLINSKLKATKSPLKALSVLLPLFFFWLWMPADLEARDLLFENFSSHKICEFYLSPAGQERWDRDFFQGDCLASGQHRELTLKIDPNAPVVFDALAFMEDGSHIVYLSLDFSTFSFISLGDFEAELFDFDPSKRGGH